MHAFGLSVADEDRIEAEAEEIVPQRLEARLVEPRRSSTSLPDRRTCRRLLAVRVTERDEHAIDARKALLPRRVLHDHGDDVPAFHDRAGPRSVQAGVMKSEMTKMKLPIGTALCTV